MTHKHFEWRPFIPFNALNGRHGVHCKFVSAAGSVVVTQCKGWFFGQTNQAVLNPSFNLTTRSIELFGWSGFCSRALHWSLSLAPLNRSLSDCRSTHCAKEHKRPNRTPSLQLDFESEKGHIVNLDFYLVNQINRLYKAALRLKSHWVSGITEWENCLQIEDDHLVNLTWIDFDFDLILSSKFRL